MNLDYQEIMEMPEPVGGADMGVMETLCDVYGHLVRKFTRMLDEALMVKSCWMQEERIRLYTKRLAANKREYARAKKQRRRGEITNFCLRVREWVLSSSTRRLQLRALIGEDKIVKWQERRQALATHIPVPPTPHRTPKEVRYIPNDPYDCPPPTYGRIGTKRSEVENWYRLPHLRKPKPLRITGAHLNMNHLNMDHLPLGAPGRNTPHTKKQKTGKRRTEKLGPTGMRRAAPAVVFWPAELVADYVHAPTMPEVPPKKHFRENRAQVVDEDLTQMRQTYSRTAKEWPD